MPLIPHVDWKRNVIGFSRLLLAIALYAAAQVPLMAEEPACGCAFPADMVSFTPYEHNPIFTAAGPGTWEAKIRERGWILRDGDVYHLWYTGYDGTRDGIKLLGHATSSDGIHWKRDSGEPIYRDGWIEDMTVVAHDGKFYMFAEGKDDQAQWLTSTDGVHWHREGSLDVRMTDGKPIKPGPYGTPTVWFEDGTWYLLYERMDLGIWLATTKDLKVWTNVQDEPVMVPGPGAYDDRMIAVNQVVRHDGCYYAYYHGSGSEEPGQWNTDVAVSRDLIHWTKYPGNPILRDNKSSGILINDGTRNRLYTLHEKVQLHFEK